MRMGLTHELQNKQISAKSRPGWARSSKTPTFDIIEVGVLVKINYFGDAGHWRSWLARFHGMEEVIGSNPICSTIFKKLCYN